MSIVYRNFLPEDESNILKLFYKSFNKELAVDYWIWRYKNNPNRGCYIKLAEDEATNELVAHYALSPTEIYVEGKKYNSALSMTTMTHPQYRGLRLFTNLATQLYSENENRLDVICGVPNDNSLKGFTKYLDFKMIAEIHPYTLEKDYARGLESSNCIEIERFDSSIDALLKAMYEKYSIILARNVAFLNWRYIDNPSNSYRKFGLRKGEKIVGYIIVKVFHGQESCMIDIVDVLAEDKSVFEELVSHVLAIYKQQNISRFNIWMNDIELVGSLKQMGFIQSKDSFHFIVKKNSKKIEGTIDDYSKWYLTMGDIDIF